MYYRTKEKTDPEFFAEALKEAEYRVGKYWVARVRYLDTKFRVKEERAIIAEERKVLDWQSKTFTEQRKALRVERDRLLARSKLLNPRLEEARLKLFGSSRK